MSPVEACNGCGGLFPFLPRGMCALCIDQRESSFEQVRAWLIENRGATIRQAVEASGVEESLILAFIREGRLEFLSAATIVPEDEDLRARIRRDLAARESAAPAPLPTGPRGMRTRAS